MMEYDIHGTWDGTSVWTGAFVAAHTNLTEIDQSVKLMCVPSSGPKRATLTEIVAGGGTASARPRWSWASASTAAALP